jgi:hypothetical protein
MFKLEVVDFVKEKGNREAARKFNVGRDQSTGMEERRSGHKVFKSKATCNEVQEMLLARTFLHTLAIWMKWTKGTCYGDANGTSKNIVYARA